MGSLKIGQRLRSLNRTVAVALVILVIAAGWWAWSSYTTSRVQSFAACQSASGSKVLDVSPKLCITENGRRFSAPAHKTSGVIIDITSFSECASVGGAVANSYPRSCSYGSQHFTEPVITIKQWGVTAPYSGLPQLQYTLEEDSRVDQFTSSQLSQLDSSCTTGYGGSIGRFKPQEVIPGSGETAAQIVSRLPKSRYVLVAGYYYIFEHAQSACPGAKLPVSSEESQTQTDTNNTVQGLLQNLIVIPKK